MIMRFITCTEAALENVRFNWPDFSLDQRGQTKATKSEQKTIFVYLVRLV